MSMEAQQLMKFLKMVQKMLIHHQYTIEAMKESLGDSVIVALSSARNCDHPDCVYPATVRQVNCSSRLCDRHLSEKIVLHEAVEVEWEDLHYADCVRNLLDYIELKNAHNKESLVH